MRILDRESFLLIQYSKENSSYEVKVLSSQDKAIANWTSSTRISPIFKVDGFANSQIDHYDFSGQKVLLFIGPIHPEKIIAYCGTKSNVWLSIGLYNIIAVPHDKREVTKLTQTAQKEKVPYEMWDIKSGIVQGVTLWSPERPPKDYLDPLIRLSKISFPDELQEAVREYGPLMASTLSRSASLPPHISDELKKTSLLLAEMFADFSQPPSLERTYQYLSELLTINAGLSRFSSQTFAGTSPLTHTECHFWSNSLLGIGTATIALRNIRSFLDKTLGESRLPERFEALKKIKTNVPDLQKEYPPDKDYLGEAKIDPETEPIIPLISYFSARDGYRSTPTTISAPLASVFSCNCPRWSLMTVTHEISHVVIRAILSDLYPDFSDAAQVEECRKLFESSAIGPTLFHEIQRILFFSVCMMDDVFAGHSPGDIRSVDFAKLLQRWRRDIDETMVHTFDFLYFYGKDVDRYVSGIWAS